MNKNVYIAIDPGKSGFISIFNGESFDFYPMPTKKVESGELLKSGKPRMKTVYDKAGLVPLLFEIHKKYEGCKKHGIIEDVNGREGWSAQNNFNFGHTAGMQELLLHILCETVEEVKPQKWQAVMYQGHKKIMKPSSTGKTLVHDTKATSELVAKALAPDIDFRKTEKAKTTDDNKTDAFLMCLYLYKHIHKQK